MIVVHYTPYKTSFLGGKLRKVYKKQPFRPFLNVAKCNNYDEAVISVNYIHHGMRTNNARGLGLVNVPCAVLIDITGLSYQKGYDGPTAIQVNEAIPSDRILSVIEIDPSNMIHNFVEGVGQKPKGYERLGRKKYIPFRQEMLFHKLEIAKTLMKGLKMKITAIEKQFVLRQRIKASSLAKAELLTILNNIDLIVDDLKNFKITYIRDKRVDKAIKQIKTTTKLLEDLRSDL